jgi:hypothetical protein
VGLMRHGLRCPEDRLRVCVWQQGQAGGQTDGRTYRRNQASTHPWAPWLDLFTDPLAAIANYLLLKGGHFSGRLVTEEDSAWRCLSTARQATIQHAALTTCPCRHAS